MLGCSRTAVIRALQQMFLTPRPESFYFCAGIAAVFRIRMDPGFFADPDPDFKNPDPDPSINKPMGSKWCFWLGFGVTWPKRTVLRMLNMKLKKFLLLLTFLGRFFMDPDPDFSGSDPDFRLIRIWTQGKKFYTDPDLKQRIAGITENICYYFWPVSHRSYYTVCNY